MILNNFIIIITKGKKELIVFFKHFGRLDFRNQTIELLFNAFRFMCYCTRFCLLNYSSSIVSEYIN